MFVFFLAHAPSLDSHKGRLLVSHTRATITKYTTLAETKPLMELTKLQEKEQEFEIELRGTTLNFSIKFELMLMHIIYFSNSEQYVSPHKSPSLKIKNLTFGGKLKRAKELLEKFHPDLLVIYDDVFEQLDGFLEIRNKMAHCELRWKDDRLEILEIWDVEEDDTQIQFYSPTKYTRLGLTNIMVTYLNQIRLPLTSLVIEVQNRLKTSAPVLFAQLFQVSFG